VLFDVRRVGDVPGFEIPSRFFRFLRSGDPRPLEPVLEHNRLDLVSLAAVTARAVRLAQEGADACGDAREALALGRVYERTGSLDAAESCYRRAAVADAPDVRAEAIYRLGLRLRRARRFGDAAACWRVLLDLTETVRTRHQPPMRALRNFAAEALAIHHEHRDRDLPAARELALFALEEAEETGSRADGIRHRLARLERKIAGPGRYRRTDTSGAPLFT
jgi:tetratricopeptide (TPR) repeat protein